MLRETYRNITEIGETAVFLRANPVSRLRYEAEFVVDMNGDKTDVINHYYVSVIVADKYFDSFLNDLTQDSCKRYTNCADMDLMGDGNTHGYFICHTYEQLEALDEDVKRVNRLGKWRGF